jgi:hypothetical protein
MSSRHLAASGSARWPLAIVALVGLALAGPAAAVPRISIAPVKGDKRGAVGVQLEAALCTTHRCVPGALKGSGKARLERARRMGVKAAVFAAVKKQRRRSELAVALVSPSGRSLGSWSLPFERGLRVAPDRLEQLSDEVGQALGETRQPAAPAPAPEPMASAPRNPYPGDDGARPAAWGGRSAQARAAPAGGPAAPAGGTEVVTVPISSEPSEPQDSYSSSSPSYSAGADAYAPPRSRTATPRASLAGPVPPAIGADAGVEAAQHSLKFPTNGTAPVGYVVNLDAVPWARLEGYPLRELGLGETMESVGLFADGAYLPGIPLSAGSKTFKMSYMRFRLGAMMPFQFESGLTLRPAIAYEAESVSVRAAGGARFPGLPDTRLAGPSLGLDATYPAGTRLTLLAGGRGVLWTQAGELAGNKQFFPKGSASGIDLEAGAAFKLGSMFSVRAVGFYGVTTWSLSKDPSSAYTVRSAKSESLGVRGSIRLER